MKTFLLFIVVAIGLLFYLNVSNSDGEINAVQQELHNSVKPQEKDGAFYQEKIDMIEPSAVAQAPVTLPVTEELDTVIPSAHQPASSPHESLASGTDEIGGYYDGSARSPESESQQVNDVVSIGIDAADVLVPEMDFDYINIEGSGPSISTGGAASVAPEIDEK